MKNYRPTEKQNVARARNWRIRSLRALWAQVGMLGHVRATAARKLIDDELADMGAERESDRKASFYAIPF